MAMNSLKILRLVGSFIVLALAALAIHGYLEFGDSLFLVGAITLPVMVLGEWWQQYRHRADPDWPRRRQPQADTRTKTD
jgi:hypothetical protein